MVIKTPPSSWTLLLLAQDRAQSSADKTIHQLMYQRMSLLEVIKPPAQHGIKISDNTRQAVSTRAFSLHLSIDTTKDAGDRLLTGSRAVPVLNPGATSTGTGTVTIPTSTPPGTYYVLACADDTVRVSEIDETNNCRASAGKVQITRPDLWVTAVSNPRGDSRAEQ